MKYIECFGVSDQIFTMYRMINQITSPDTFYNIILKKKILQNRLLRILENYIYDIYTFKKFEKYKKFKELNNFE